MKETSNRTILFLIAACLVLMVVLVACSSGSSKVTQTATAEPAPIDGATLLETRCSVCHGVDRATSAKKTQSQWEQTVTRMIGKGAKLTDAEKTILVEYLFKNYGQ